MVEVLWARHGQNVANLTRTLSYRVFDGDLTQTGREQARALAGRLAADGGEPIGYLPRGHAHHAGAAQARAGGGLSAAWDQLMPWAMTDWNPVSRSSSPERSMCPSGGRCQSQQSRSAAMPLIVVAAASPASVAATWRMGSS